MQIKYFNPENWNFEVPGTEKWKVRAMQNEIHSNHCSFQLKLPD